MKIAVIGTGYVGLVTGVSLSEVGHKVTCIDIDTEKVKKMKQGISPIYEPGLEELMRKNIKLGRLKFTTKPNDAFECADIVMIAVGTPQLPNGSANLSYIEEAAKTIGEHIKKDTVVVTKSTVPVGTNKYIKQIIKNNLTSKVEVKIVSNPEFLREGSAIHDCLYGDRIVIGVEDNQTAKVLEEMYKPFKTPIFKTDINSAEMIKYASNAFLATKISFINEVSNICEKINANVEDVAEGMGFDRRIGRAFLNAGIGYGGSCFPKDTNALVQIAGGVAHDFHLLKSVIEVNNNQHKILVQKLLDRFDRNITGKKIGVLGLAFKPGTDDIRDAASITIINCLLNEGAEIIAYDPIAIEKAKKVLSSEVIFANSLEEVIEDVEAVLLVTEWEEFKVKGLKFYAENMSSPIVFDGRNCFSLEEGNNLDIEYYSIGRNSIKKERLILNK
ncbi:UDP-glucose dehydrogenase family protein [Priestia megaterium]|uniref:UDP-glucose dehydrogenase family protein n=1 Tax=Priestia megaterium TaxID=1404 RepID=UPI00222102DC|nr:UDP-glucose/GDP-mannose dehydrogenase family protein [Priestia megaterium]UYV55466.1 UDP-glucose/GDP-mannose dehydrogenase family protein [Priestia megaterium]